MSIVRFIYRIIERWRKPTVDQNLAEIRERRASRQNNMFAYFYGSPETVLPEAVLQTLRKAGHDLPDGATAGDLQGRSFNIQRLMREFHPKFNVEGTVTGRFTPHEDQVVKFEIPRMGRDDRIIEWSRRFSQFLTQARDWALLSPADAPVPYETVRVLRSYGYKVPDDATAKWLAEALTQASPPRAHND